MSVTIRLARIGRKNLPAYKIVVTNTRDKRNGRFIELLGHFNPSATPQEFKYDKEKFEKWVKDGALVTDSIQRLIDGKYNYVKYSPKQANKKASGGEKTETSVEEPKTEEKVEEKVEEKKEEAKEKVKETPKEKPKKEASKEEK